MLQKCYRAGARPGRADLCAPTRTHARAARHIYVRAGKLESWKQAGSLSGLEAAGAGLMFTGLLLGAATGMLELLLGAAAAGGLLLAGQAGTKRKPKEVPYPTYKY